MRKLSSGEKGYIIGYILSGGLVGSTEFGDLSDPVTVDRVVVDHARCLHMGVTDRGSDEPEASFFEIFAQGLGDFCLCG